MLNMSKSRITDSKVMNIDNASLTVADTFSPEELELLRETDSLVDVNEEADTALPVSSPVLKRSMNTAEMARSKRKSLSLDKNYAKVLLETRYMRGNSPTSTNNVWYMMEMKREPETGKRTYHFYTESLPSHISVTYTDDFRCKTPPISMENFDNKFSADDLGNNF